MHGPQNVGGGGGIQMCPYSYILGQPDDGVSGRNTLLNEHLLYLTGFTMQV